MGNFGLNNKDKNIVNKLIKTTKEIMDIYEILSCLEKNSKKESREYKNAIYKLNYFIEEENKIYKEIGTNVYKIHEILMNLFGYDSDNIADVLTFIINKDKKNLIFSRIYYNLNYIISFTDFDKNENIELDEEDEIEDFDSTEDLDDLFEDSLENDYESDYFYEAILQNEVEKDIVNTIFRILNEYINEDKYSNINKYLIDFKYELCFYIKFLEKNLIDNNFNINEDLYWGANIIADFNVDTGNEDLENNKKSFINEILLEQTENIIDLYFDDINDETNFAKLIIIQIIIRTCMIFLKDEDIIFIKNKILNEIRDIDISNKIVEDVIINSFNKRDYDKNLPKILVFLKKDK